jgi:hypothetical protein
MSWGEAEKGSMKRVLTGLELMWAHAVVGLCLSNNSPTAISYKG